MVVCASAVLSPDPSEQHVNSMKALGLLIEAVALLVVSLALGVIGFLLLVA